MNAIVKKIFYVIFGIYVVHSLSGCHAGLYRASNDQIEQTQQQIKTGLVMF